MTQPSLEMREAIAQAPVGDDVFRDDPTVLQLEKKVQKITALFLHCNCSFVRNSTLLYLNTKILDSVRYAIYGPMLHMVQLVVY